MHKLFNELNVGYTINSSFVKVIFKKKYIFVLEKLLKLNCISSFTIEDNYILIKLRYFKNKPLFLFSIKSTGGNKCYKKMNNFFWRDMKNSFSSLSLFFTSYGLLTYEELLYKHVGGEHVVDIFFLDKK